MEIIDSEKEYFRYWGKARKKDNGMYEYHPLVFHCLDVAAVGRHLMQPGTRRNKDISIQTGLSPESVIYLFVLNLLIHDLGKFSSCFQSLIEQLFRKIFPDKKIRAYEERHDTLGYVLWREVIKNTLTDKNENLATFLDFLVKTGFGHHGHPPKESALQGNALLRVQTFFDKGDIAASVAYFEDCIMLLGDAPSFPDINKSKQSLKFISWQFAGVTILADWIGSNSLIFSYPFEKAEQIPLLEYWEKYALPRAAEAVAEVGWEDRRIRPFNGIIDLFPKLNTPTPLQKHVAETEINPGPKLWIVEDVTGAGKTEAALILAQRMMATGEADGFYIGLPTMATANAMYERLQNAYEKLYHEGEKPSLVLSHGMCHLSKKFQKTIGLPAQTVDAPYGEEENARGYCNEWIADNRKKALLADVGVGTIDQAILGILPARHQSLRLAGLYRKILIVDEVHAYDAYVEHLLGVLLEAHAINGGSAILLSATIPMKIRQKLIGAFQSGLKAPIAEDKISDISFPLVTQVSAAGVSIWPNKSEVKRAKRREMGVEFLYESALVLERIIKDSAAGKCVCWIRNTVKDARQAFDELIKSGIDESKIDLFHSRFAMIDRSRIENAVLRNFGKESGTQERTGRILIATQVVEQSLDLDFDCMVSDLAPIDLLIQRAGRMHRHTRNKTGAIIKNLNVSDKRPSPNFAIFAPEFSTTPDGSWLKGEFKGTAAVYKHAGRLWLTQKVLLEKGGWTMPDEARKLIEAVYGEDAEEKIPEGLKSASNRAQGQEQAQKGMGHLNALILKRGYCRDAVQVDQWDENEKVQTRLTEENREIVLAVYQEGVFIPYAEQEEHSWDWSTLTVSQSAWKSSGYSIPQEYTAAVEELKNQNPRLNHCEVVIVNKRSASALSSNTFICEYYHPCFGWGASLNDEEE